MVHSTFEFDPSISFKNSNHLVLITLWTESQSTIRGTLDIFIITSTLWKVYKLARERIAHGNRLIARRLGQAKQAIARIHNLVLVILWLQIKATPPLCAGMIPLVFEHILSIAQWGSSTWH